MSFGPVLAGMRRQAALPLLLCAWAAAACGTLGVDEPGDAVARAAAPEAALPQPTPPTQSAAVPSNRLVDQYLDRQAREVRGIPGAVVTRAGDTLGITFASDALFASDSAVLTSDGQDRLRRLASTFRQYPDTEVEIDCHSDSTGHASDSRELSQRRADAVRRVLVDGGVASHRVTARGQGESAPLATNSTAEGRARNRRIEVTVQPSPALRERGENRG